VDAIMLSTRAFSWELPPSIASPPIIVLITLEKDYVS
jgi:hypothetical protein